MFSITARAFKGAPQVPVITHVLSPAMFTGAVPISWMGISIVLDKPDGNLSGITLAQFDFHELEIHTNLLITSSRREDAPDSARFVCMNYADNQMCSSGDTV